MKKPIIDEDKVYSIEEIVDIDENYLVAVASMKDTHLPYDLYLCSEIIKEYKPSIPCIKIKIKRSFIPISISDKPVLLKRYNKKIESLNLVKNYIKAYKDILLAHYNNIINDRMVLELLGSVKCSEINNMFFKAILEHEELNDEDRVD